MNPTSPLHTSNRPLGPTLLDFWAWNQSNLLENRTRGILAEFIVMKALGINSEQRIEWDNYDLITESGIKIEVKSAAYLQAWEQKQLSTIRFNIAPKRIWTKESGRSGPLTRDSDYYVFCPFHHKDQGTVDPLNVDQWTFYVLSTEVLNTKRPEQKSIGLRGLEELGAKRCNFKDLNMEVL
jgi:hypothetical protein